MILTRLTRLSATLVSQLLTKSVYLINMPRRDPSIPTIRDQTIKPFKIQFLHNNKGSRRYPKKLGRGPGSGKGKFAGRGMKGQKARAGGGVPVSFEGGQTPIQKRLPKYGRVKRTHAQQFFNTVNMHQLDYFIKKGIINKEQPITIKTLNDVGLVKKVKIGVKILGKGAQKINYPIQLQVSDASKSVIQAVQAAGGSVKLIHRTPLKLREHMYPEKFQLPLRDPITPAWRLRKLERKSKDRGVEVHYVKPQWKIEEEKQLQELKASGEYVEEKQFVYPVPQVSNSDKIRTRKPKLYKKILYNL